MYLGKRIWATVVGWLHFSSVSQDGAEQNPIGGLTHHSHNHDAVQIDVSKGGQTIPPPRFIPPGSAKDSDLECKYPDMKGWEPCSTPNNRECWLRNPKTGEEYNIHTNYEDNTPVGVTRWYGLNVTDGEINADGQWFPGAKWFNGTFPGPLIQACWGDRIIINVTNNLKHNGTSIHWHGLRQHNTMHMDGVNGITQCPIAGRSWNGGTKPDGSPLDGDHFVYNFTAKQYGTSWYHSHYSVQYADGLQGPIMIHGPTSANWDEPKAPLLMTDWSHNTAFSMLSNDDQQDNKTILLNGRGNVYKYGYEPEDPQDPPATYELHFQAKDVSRPGRGKRYLLRLINTSFDSTFVVSIDNHWMQIISADFVPIQPYFNTSVLVGIGQRYTVVVEANPEAGPTNPLPNDGNYWIRTWIANNCGRSPAGRLGYERTGILRYNPLSDTEPKTQPWNNIALSCSDETYTSLKPKFPWYVGPPSNGISFGSNGKTVQIGEPFAVTYGGSGSKYTKPEGFPLAAFSFEPNAKDAFTPLQINYSDPSFLHLWQNSKEWPPQWVAIDQNYTKDDWVWLVLSGRGTSTYGAHPIHLHGHDFAILEQVENRPFDPAKFSPNVDNPPRRDVVLLPGKGYVAIAFKLDNPGTWLMHCHIARHASEGLGIQINERQADANKIWPFHEDSAIAEANRTCANWHKWVGDCKNHWPGMKGGKNPACHDDIEPDPIIHPFQDDSGI